VASPAIKQRDIGRAQSLRPFSMSNPGGGFSTVRMAQSDNVAFPTIFPKDPTKPSNNPEDWLDFGKNFEGALVEAKRRGELFVFDTVGEAENFALNLTEHMGSSVDNKPPIFVPKDTPLIRGNTEQAILDRTVQPEVPNIPFVPDFLEDLFAGLGGGTAGILAQGVNLLELAAPEERFGGVGSFLVGSARKSDFSGIRKKLQEAAALPLPSGTPKEFTKIGPEDALNFVAAKVGEAIPGVAAFIGAGAPVAALGAGARLAAGIGLLGVLNTGEVYTTARKEGRSPETAAKLALAVGGSGAVLDGVFFHRVGGRLVANKVKDALVKELVTSGERSAVRKAVRDAAAAGVSDAALFSTLSVTKEIASTIAESVFLNKEIVPEELLIRLINEAASGVVVGGALGVTSGAVGARESLRRARKGRDLNEEDFTSEALKKLEKIEPSTAPALVVGDKYTKGEVTYEILKSDPAAVKGVGEVTVKVTKKDGAVEEQKFTDPAFRKSVQEGSERIARPVEGLQVSEAIERLGENAREVAQGIEEGVSAKELSTSLVGKGFSSEDSTKLVGALERVIRPLEGEVEAREVRSSKTVGFDPEPIKQARLLSEVSALPKAPESVELGIEAILDSGSLGRALDSLSKGDTAEVAVSKINDTNVSNSALARALNFVSGRLRRIRSIPEGLVIGDVEVSASKGTEVLNRLGLLTESVELLQEGRSPAQIAGSFKATYVLDIPEAALSRRIGEIKAGMSKIEAQEGDYRAPESEAAIAAENAGEPSTVLSLPRRGLRSRDLITFVRGPGFEAHVGSSTSLVRFKSVRVNYQGIKGEKKSLDIKFSDESMLPVSVYISGKHKNSKAFEGAVKEYLSDFRVDSFKALPPVPEPSPRGFERSGRFEAFGRRVDVYASKENSAETMKVRLRQEDGKPIESEVFKRSPSDPDRVAIYVDGKVKNLQAFVLARIAVDDTLVRSKSSSIQAPFKVRYTKSGTEVKELDSEGLFDKFVAEKPEVERVLDVTARGLDTLRGAIQKSSKSTRAEAKELTDGVLSIGGLVSDVDHGIVIPQSSLFSSTGRSSSSVYVNPFSDLSGRSSPTGLAARTAQTMIHELAHVPAIGTGENHGLDFSRRYSRFSEAVSGKAVESVIAELAKELDDGTGKFKPGVAEAVRGITEAVRRRAGVADARAGEKSFAVGSQGVGRVEEGATKGVQRGGERDFWRGETGLDGENLDRFVRVRREYEDHLRAVYRGGPPPDGLSVDFKKFARSRGIDPDTVDGGSPEHIVEGLRAKDVLDSGLGSNPVERDVARADVERINKVQAKMLGLFDFVKKIPTDAEANEYLKLRVEENAFRNNFAIGVNHVVQKIGNVGKDQSGRALIFAAERSLKSSKLKRRLTPEENTALAKVHEVNEFGLEVVRDVETILDSGLDLLRTELEARVKRVLAKEPELLKSRLGDIKKDFEALKKINYFPLSRFGNHVIKVEAPLKEGGKRRDVVTREQFETEREMKARLGEVLKEFPESKGFKVTTPKVDDTGAALLGFPPALLDSIKGRLDLTESQVGELRDLMVSMNPGQGFLKHVRTRHGIPGFSREGERAFVEYANSMASHVARLRYGHRFDEIVGRVKEQVKQLQGSQQFDEARQRRIVEGVLESHNEHSKNPGKELSSLRGALFKYFLAFSPKTVAIQLTQVPFYTRTELAARSGIVSEAGVVKEIVGAYNTVWKTFDLSRPDHFNTLHKALRIDQSNMFTELYNEGVLTDSLAKLVAGGQVPKVLGRIPGLRKLGSAVDRAIDTLGNVGLDGFQGAEEMNRRVTALASYEVAIKNGKSFEDAVNFARSMVNDTQFVYAPYNKIPLARGGASKAAQLRSMAFLLRSFNVFSTNFALSSKGRAQFNLQMLAMAGIAGLPAAELALTLIDTGAQVFGPHPFGIEDAKFQSRREIMELSQTLGLKPSTLLHGLSHSSFGLPAVMRLMGGNFPEFDLSASIGLGNVIPGVEPLLRLAQGTTSFPSAVTQSAMEIGGPGASLGGTVARTVADDGPRSSLLRQATPVGVRNLIKAYGLVKDKGHLDRQGNLLIDYDVHNPLQAAEILGQALGFRPMIMADVSEINFLQREFETYVNNLREQLLSQYALAVQTKGEERTQRLKVINGKIVEFNQTVDPRFGITGEALDRSLNERIKGNFFRQWGLPRAKRFQGKKEPLREELNERLVGRRQ